MKNVYGLMVREQSEFGLQVISEDSAERIINELECDSFMVATSGQNLKIASVSGNTITLTEPAWIVKGDVLILKTVEQ